MLYLRFLQAVRVFLSTEHGVDLGHLTHSQVLRWGCLVESSCFSMFFLLACFIRKSSTASHPIPPGRGCGKRGVCGDQGLQLGSQEEQRIGNPPEEIKPLVQRYYNIEFE